MKFELSKIEHDDAPGFQRAVTFGEGSEIQEEKTQNQDKTVIKQKETQDQDKKPLLEKQMSFGPETQMSFGPKNYNVTHILFKFAKG